ncbi:MAG: DUF7521 family protein [Halohasta sp.]
MTMYTLLLTLTNAVTLITGGILAVFAHRAFRRTHVDALETATVGFGCLVVGGGGATILYTVGGTIRGGVLLQSVCTAAGVSILLYSLYRTPEQSTLPRRPTNDT